MVELFGLDIAKVVNDEVTNAGGVRDGSLAKQIPGTRTGGSLTGGTNPTTTTHTFKGFVQTKEVRRSGQLGAGALAVVAILGASISPVAVPEVNDEATVDGVTYVLVELLSRDPAEALFEFRGEAL